MTSFLGTRIPRIKRMTTDLFSESAFRVNSSNLRHLCSFSKKQKL